MPLHDWTRVESGIFHDFHTTWMVELKRELVRTLPSGYYAMVEQTAGGYGPDVLTQEDAEAIRDDGPPTGGVAVVDAPPRVQFELYAETEVYAARARHLSVRHVSRNRVVAVIEIVSPGNKGSEYPLSRFVQKAIDLIRAGLHFAVADPHPPGRNDPDGVHALIWDRIDPTPFAFPEGNDRLVASYRAGLPVTAYLNTLAVGDPLPEMPLFLSRDRYLPVDLEASYLRAYEMVPPPDRRVLEA